MLLDHASKYPEDTLCVQAEVGRGCLLSSDEYKFLFLLAHGTVMKSKALCQLSCLWHSLVASATAMRMPSYLN